MALSRYVQQLVEDIRNAAKNAPKQPEHGPTTDDELTAHFEEIDRYLNPDNETDVKIGSWVGLSTANFPPKEKLNDEEKEAIISELHHTLFHFNFAVDVPDELPLDFHYDLMLRTLDYETMMTSFGTVTMDFCGGWPDDCELKQYCTCRHFEFEDTDEEIPTDNDWQQRYRKLPPGSVAGGSIRKLVDMQFRSIEDREFILSLLENYPGIVDLTIEDAPPRPNDLPF